MKTGRHSEMPIKKRERENMRNKTSLTSVNRQEQGHSNMNDESNAAQAQDRQSRTGKKEQNRKRQNVPDLDPCLKFHMAMNLMGEKTAREYLVWLFMDEQTGQLPPGSEECIEHILERTLVRNKRSELAEPQSA
jgi:hypothetical protein